MRAVVYSVLPWIIAAPVFGLFIFISVVSTSASPMWNNGMDIVLYTFLDFGAIFFCFSAFALWLSLRTKKNHALAICILTTILSSLFCRPFILLVSLDNTFGMGSRFLMPFLDAAVHIVIGASFLANARSNFRATVLKHMG